MNLTTTSVCRRQSYFRYKYLLFLQNNQSIFTETLRVEKNTSSDLSYLVSNNPETSEMQDINLEGNGRNDIYTTIV